MRSPNRPNPTGPRPAAPGLEARRRAADALDRVLRSGASMDEALQDAPALEPRDRALAFHILAVSLRRLGTLRTLLAGMLERGLPRSAPRLEAILLTGAAQILFMDVPDHAAVGLAVDLARSDRSTGGYAGLANAVLRRVAREGAARLADIDPLAVDTPDWLRRRWIDTYGADTAAAIAAIHAKEPALDISVKADPELWAERLSGEVLPTGTVRVLQAGPIRALPGFAEGAWWVQDAAAALPARLLGPVAGLRVADLCAAPGGKTAQLAAAGAQVTAIDRSGERLVRLKENLARLNLAATCVAADAATYQGGPFDAVLLDAPCTATGTLRRHPDIAWSKRPQDIATLAALQARLLDRALDLVRPGGLLVYSTCSLEREEGEDQIARLLSARPDAERVPIDAKDGAAVAAFTTPQGDLRTLPCDWMRGEPERSGLDGFFAARLRKRD
ncbi:RsmB/NOP family class I SAM-dependent RNA methyltransferase [Aquabacter spiritensis]|uniref:16S rRNA (Cytosine967-C5)-methyltransferase n=1 Tax=Aquabacter spiritensis TaxID=933073 RepID=A0A4R3M1G3_9HYPH|nr:RsmB/NOP family class I SAM-dependent RNA methyltransferase [Aquabacter spiritensis]TCT06900.1 16S rRNA (cytosine967-C5)-methyltransferase [Aquabacter spiritensis]